jgi:predicted esterase
LWYFLCAAGTCLPVGKSFPAALRRWWERIPTTRKSFVPFGETHGDKDTIVPLEQNSAELARRYRALGGPMELRIVPGKGHEEVDEFFQCQAVVGFFLKHLGR